MPRNAKGLRMKILTLGTLIAVVLATPASAADFLGATLCTKSVNTSVSLPDDSPLTLLSVEVGKHGALVMLLEGKPSRILDDVDDLMTELTGNRGTGTSQQLQWSGNSFTGFGKIIRKGNVALVVSTSDDCSAGQGSAAAPLIATEIDPQPEPTQSVAPMVTKGTAASPEPESAVPVLMGAGTVAAATTVVPRDEQEGPPIPVDTNGFRLEGGLRHSPAGDDWVDVMGVVVNPTGDDYRLATFDVALFDASGELICVDTVSVSQLQSGRRRAFRDSIQCQDYAVGSVDRITFEFAGGY